MKIKENNHLYLLSLLVESQQNSRHSRKELAMKYSDGFKTNLKDLDELETVMLISALETQLKKSQSDFEFIRGDYGRARMIKLSIQYGFTKQDLKAGKVIVDMSKLDRWLLKNGIFKKKLEKYTYRELPFLIDQFEIVVKSHLKTI